MTRARAPSAFDPEEPSSWSSSPCPCGERIPLGDLEAVMDHALCDWPGLDLPKEAPDGFE